MSLPRVSTLITCSVTAPRKLLFDECIGRPLVENLREMVSQFPGTQHEIRHLLEFYEQGVWDEVWIPQVAKEDCVIVTGDRGGVRGGKGDQLWKVCQKFQITHVVLSPRVNQRKSADKICTILSVWHELLEVFNSPRGSRWNLEPRRVSKADAELGYGDTKGQLVLIKPVTPSQE